MKVKSKWPNVWNGIIKIAEKAINFFINVTVNKFIQGINTMLNIIPGVDVQIQEMSVSLDGLKANTQDLADATSDAAKQFGPFIDEAVTLTEDSITLGEGLSELADKTEESTEAMRSAFEKMDDVLDTTQKNIDDINTSITELKVGKVQDMNREWSTLAEAFVDAQENVAKLQDQIAQATDTDTSKELQTQLDKEMEVLQGKAHLQKLLEDDIARIKEDRAKTSLELALDEFSESSRIIDEKFQLELTALETKLEKEQGIHDAVSKMKEQAVEITRATAMAETEITITAINLQIEAYNALAKAAENARAGQTTASVSVETASKALSDISIPAFARGGIVTKPTVGLIGEAGAEAVIPLSKAGQMGIGGGGTTINIEWSGAVDERAAEMVAREVARVLDMEGRTSIGMGIA